MPRGIVHGFGNELEPFDTAVVHLQPGTIFCLVGSQPCLCARARRKAICPAETLDHCAAVLDESLDRPLLEVMFNSSTDLLDQTRYTQPALFALEMSLARLWQSWGLQPDVLLGHSVGQLEHTLLQLQC